MPMHVLGQANGHIEAFYANVFNKINSVTRLRGIV